LLALVGLSKKQQKLPRDAIDLAKRRLRDWRSRQRREPVASPPVQVRGRWPSPVHRLRDRATRRPIGAVER
jgi:hypothetical protein